MGEKVIIDPVTRIEGHLKIEIEVENNSVKDAWLSGTMARGFEILLQGKDPRDAQRVTQRICGVCPTPHTMASVGALDSAFSVELPENARLIRNLILGSNWIQSHILHFYHLVALDYLDITAIANYGGADPQLLEVKGKIAKLSANQDTYPLTPRYQPDEFSVSDPTVVITAVAHYLEALEMCKKAHVMLAILGGKMPLHVTTVVGGVTQFPTIDKIAAFRANLLELQDWISNIYLVDVLHFGTGPLLALGQQGVGKGVGNFLSYGGFDLDKAGSEKLFPRGAIFDSKISQVEKVDINRIKEEVKYSWYTDACGEKKPAEGKTEYKVVKDKAYSFLKAPRYDGKPMEVGPLARLLVKQDKTLLSLVKDYGIQVGALARVAARAVECKLVADSMIEWLDELVENIKSGNTDICHQREVPSTGDGLGLVEAPRGALGHWIDIKGGKIARYQCVVPTTWNGSPRDNKNKRGPIEEALVGTPVTNVENPINVVRVVRSFDPCIACAVHLIDPQTNQILKFQVG